MAPDFGTRPNVGRRPVVPQTVDGEEMEPSVSLPIEKPTRPAAVADAGPALDPLDPCSTFHGFFVIPPNQTSPMASSPSVSLATSTAPSASSRWTTVASSSNRCSLYGGVPHVVG